MLTTQRVFAAVIAAALAGFACFGSRDGRCGGDEDCVPTKALTRVLTRPPDGKASPGGRDDAG